MTADPMVPVPASELQEAIERGRFLEAEIDRLTAALHELETALRMFPCQCRTAGDGKGPNRLVAQCLRCGALYPAAAPSEETK